MPKEVPFNRFQVGKCTFGERRRFKHEINPEFTPRESVMVEKKKKDFTKGKKKKLSNTNIKRILNPNNYRNSTAGQRRGNYVAGQPPKYSNEQIITIKVLLKLTVTMRKNMILKITIILHGYFQNPPQLQILILVCTF